MAGVGQVRRLGIRVRDESGADLNANTVALTITRPDGTSVAVDVLNPPAATGRYLADYVPTVAGLHTYRWVTTQPATEQESSFYVTAPGAVGALSLREAKRLLRIPDTDTKSDETVEETVRAATELAEQESRQVLLRREITETYDLGPGWREGVALIHRPVVRPVLVERLSTGGDVIESAAPPMVWTTEGGVLRSARPALLWGLVRVTYLAGPAVLSVSHRDAVRHLVQHLWPIHSGSSSRPRVPGQESSGGDDDDRNGTALPTRVRELLGPVPPLVG